MSQDNWQKTLMEKGYALFPGLADPALVTAAKAAIADDIRQNYDPARYVEYDGQSWCPDLRNSKIMMDLLHQESVWDLIGQTLGIDNVKHGNAQIAIRKAHEPDGKTIPPFHLDGVPHPHNGVTGDEIDNFTILIGVYLTDSLRDFAGNFTVWPGSHLTLQNYFRTRGPQAMREGKPELDLGQPEQLKTKAGDVVLCHYQLGHTVAGNASDNDRVAVYFRLALKDIAQRRWELLTHIWKSWKPPFQPAASQS